MVYEQRSFFDRMRVLMDVARSIKIDLKERSCRYDKHWHHN
jgi:hypothetical protein